MTLRQAAIVTLLLLSAPALAEDLGDPTQIAKGEYIARVGNCVSCHTANGGALFAGGLPMQTPFGRIYTTNITPDKTTGIGTWSYGDFARLMREGIHKDGYTVYPAMPYPAFSRMSESDLQALYVYFLHGVDAVAQNNRDSDISWPFSMRWPLAVWRWVFAPVARPFQPPANVDERMARGAYLVEGPGHCGACHTPRGWGMQERTLTHAGGGLYLSGGDIIDGWVSPSLRNDHGGGLAGWSENDIVALLKSGRNRASATFGGMSEVILHSTQYLTEEDLGAIAAYLKSLPPNNPAPAFEYDERTARALFDGKITSPGARIYLDRCAGCHRTDGRGASGVFPSLAGNPLLQTADASSAIAILLSGSAVPATKTAPSSFTMSAYGDILTDQDIAEVVSFIQTNWGNSGAGTTRDKVALQRKPVIKMAP